MPTFLQSPGESLTLHVRSGIGTARIRANEFEKQRTKRGWAMRGTKLMVVAVIGAAVLTACNNMPQLQGTTVRGCVINPNAKCPNTDFSGANLEGVDLSGADLSGSKFDAADLQFANLTNSNLDRIVMNEANLQSANLQGASYNNAIIQNINLIHATCPDGTEARNSQCQGVTSIPNNPS